MAAEYYKEEVGWKKEKKGEKKTHSNIVREEILNHYDDNSNSHKRTERVHAFDMVGLEGRTFLPDANLSRRFSLLSKIKDWRDKQLRFITMRKVI